MTQGIVEINKMVGWLEYGISTTVGYLMSNHVCAYISNIYMICNYIFSR